jgi:hypothetical protein
MKELGRDQLRLPFLVDVYEDRMGGWFLGPITSLLPTKDSWFAAASLALRYLEGWEQYRSGEDSRGRSKEFFIRGLAIALM